MKKILLIGDSIRMSYQPRVSEILNGIAEVVGPSDNCRFVKYTLWNINSWINELGKPDLVHWNNGIWDIYRQNKDMGIFTPLNEYIRDLERTLMELKKTGAKIIWATTTPVSEKFMNGHNSDIDLYNEESLKYMLKENIAVNDLNHIIKKDIEKYIGEDNLHLSESGINVCAESVSKVLVKALG